MKNHLKIFPFYCPIHLKEEKEFGLSRKAALEQHVCEIADYSEDENESQNAILWLKENGFLNPSEQNN